MAQAVRPPDPLDRRSVRAEVGVCWPFTVQRRHRAQHRPGSTAGIPWPGLPPGITNDGLPVALELDGLHGGDDALLGVSLGIEGILGPIAAPRMK